MQSQQGFTFRWNWLVGKVGGYLSHRQFNLKVDASIANDASLDSIVLADILQRLAGSIQTVIAGVRTHPRDEAPQGVIVIESTSHWLKFPAELLSIKVVRIEPTT